jgi:hypothetical protein
MKGPGLIDHLRRLVPLLLAHHPDCVYFHDDTYEFLGRRICLGCSVTYPIALLLILSAFFFDWYRNLPGVFFHQDILLVISLSLGFIQFLKYNINKGNRLLAVGSKVTLGFSLGGLMVWVFTLPIPIFLRLLLFGLSYILIQLLGVLRLRSMRMRCSECVYHGDWEICRGFRSVNRYDEFLKFSSQAAINRIIFKKDKIRKRSTVRTAHEDNPPDLHADSTWLFDDGSYSLPFVPKTGLEVERYEDIPR